MSSLSNYEAVNHLRNKTAWVIAGSMLILLLAAVAAFQMEHNGHHITAMNNHIVWGLPHVFAIFLIISASGALNVASLASVFGKSFYNPLSRLSIVLAVSLLVGGLAVILLDLGRPDRLIIAMTYYNFKSIFTWNIFLYTGFVAITVVYLWTQLDWQVNHHTEKLGKFAFVWRLILTAGTGSIFGVLIARDAYHLLVMAPLFIILSLGFGLAWFLIVSGILLRKEVFVKMAPRLCQLLIKLLVISLIASFFYHLINFLRDEARDFTQFLLFESGSYGFLIWFVQILLGIIFPALLLSSNIKIISRPEVMTASLLIVGGGIAQIFTIVIGGQAFTMRLVDGYEVMPNQFFGQVLNYVPTYWELMLGSGGIALMLLMVITQSRLFQIVPAE
jgi:Ni/Fe-hydrogenase subunit HybB-like protein